MFDASAYELAELPDEDGHGHAIAPLDERGVVDTADAGASALDVAIAACSLCTQTLGGCAIGGANAGLVSPALAFSVCGWMHRAAQRAVGWNRNGASTGYVAYVMLGNRRSRTEREAEVLALAETMR